MIRTLAVLVVITGCHVPDMVTRDGVPVTLRGGTLTRARTIARYLEAVHEAFAQRGYTVPVCRVTIKPPGSLWVFMDEGDARLGGRHVWYPWPFRDTIEAEWIPGLGSPSYVHEALHALGEYGHPSAPNRSIWASPALRQLQAEVADAARWKVYPPP
ncbi:MAG: hypothetical protein V3W06_04345 [Acidimicrobiia bacterium]